jgi:hypothetical protein
MPARLVAFFLFFASFLASSTGVVGTAEATTAGTDTLTVTAGWGGVGLPGAAIPIRVRIASERLLAGAVEVTVSQEGDTAAGRFSLPVEVAGGSVKEYVLVVPTPPVSRLEVGVLLRTGSGAVTARQTLTVQGPRDEELVGLLPAVLGGASLPGSAPLAVDAGVARFFALDEALLAQAPLSLESLGTIGVPAAGLMDLAPAARAGLLSWVDAGGRLLVDVPAGAPVEGLPAEWQPGAAGRAVAGGGEVVASDGAMAAGRWAGLVEPTRRGQAADSAVSSGERVSESLAVDAGLSARGAGWLTGFLLLYVVVVGPVTFFVLRRRRREQLAWAVIPVVAILFATGSYVQGRDLRAAETSHASVIVSGSAAAGGPRAFSFVGLIARQTETASVAFPRGWTVRIGSAAAQGVDTGPVIVGLGRSSPQAQFQLNSGQMGVAFASGPVTAGTGLEVTAIAKEGKLTGTVRNGTPFPVERAAVVIGTRGAEVGALDPGEEKPWTMSGEALFPNSDPLVSVLWPGRVIGFEDGTPASYRLWQVLQVALGADHPAPGKALAIGWTRGYEPEFVVNGHPERPQGRTMLVAEAGVGYVSGTVPSLAVARSLVRGAGFTTPGFDDVTVRGPAVARFELPAGARPTTLTLRAMNGAMVAVWWDGAWRSVDFLTGKPVDDSGLSDFIGKGGNPGMEPGVAPPIPPGVRSEVAVPKPAAPVPMPGPVPMPAPFMIGGGLVVDYTVAPPSDGVLYVRTQLGEDPTAGAYTWLREAGA